MNKLYEVIIGGLQKVIDTPAQDQTPNADGSLQHAAVAEVSHTEDVSRVDLKNVVAQNVEDVIAKVKPTLTGTQYISSVTKLNDVHA